MVAEKFPRAPEEEIFLGKEESVLDLRHEPHAEPGRLIPAVRVKNAVGLRAAAAHAPPELVELGQAEAVRAVHEHDDRVRHVHAHFDDARRHEELYPARPEVIHDLLLVFLFHPPVHHAAGVGGEDCVFHFFPHLFRRCQILLLALRDERAHHVDLPSRVHLLRHEYTRGSISRPTA